MNIKKILIIMVCLNFLKTQDTYTITAAQASLQQQALKEIENVLTEKVDEKNISAWITKVNTIIKKNKDIKIPAVQTSIKMLENIVAPTGNPKSSTQINEEKSQVIELISTSPNKDIQTLLVDMQKLELEGDKILKGLRGEKGYVFDDNQYNAWFKKTDDIIEKNINNQTKPIPKEIENLKSLQKLFEGELKTKKTVSSSVTAKDIEKFTTDEERNLFKEINAIKLALFVANIQELRGKILEIEGNLKKAEANFEKLADKHTGSGIPVLSNYLEEAQKQFLETCARHVLDGLKFSQSTEIFSLNSKIKISSTLDKKVDSEEKKDIADNLNKIIDMLNHTLMILGGFVEREDYDKKTAQDFYTALIDIIFVDDQKENSFNSVLTNVRRYIETYYIKNPSNDPEEKSFIKSVTSELEMIIHTYLVEIIHVLQQSKILTQSKKQGGLAFIENLLTVSQKEFTEKINKAYPK